MTLRQSTTLTVVGFLLFLLGFLSLTLSLVGVDLYMFSWMHDTLGGLYSFLFKLAMVAVGFICIYVGQTNWEQEEL